VSTYGCHNREPYKPEQVLHGTNSLTGEAIVTVVPFRNSPTCNYKLTDLGKADPKCDGCSHKDAHE